MYFARQKTDLVARTPCWLDCVKTVTVDSVTLAISEEGGAQAVMIQVNSGDIDCQSVDENQEILRDDRDGRIRRHCTAFVDLKGQAEKRVKAGGGK